MSATLVIGATGQQGGAVARHLLAAGRPVRAVVRDPSKEPAQALRQAGAALIQADLDDLDSLRAAFDGVESVFSMQNGYPPNGPEGEVRQGTNVVRAAKAAGVRHLVHSSVGGAERDTGIPHFVSKWTVEQRIAEAGVPATIVRPVFFMENFSSFLGPRLVDDVLQVRMAITESTRLQMIAVDDLGRIVAEMFAEPQRYLGRQVEVAGDELTGAEVADVFAKATGLPATFEEQPLAEVQAFSEDTAKMFAWFQAEGYRADLAAMRTTYPGLTTLEQWLRRVGWKPSAGWGH
jgi:uncharacterized protein YbjT (DUF2867 family)